MTPQADSLHDPPPLSETLGAPDHLAPSVLGGATASELRSERVASILDALADVVAAYDGEWRWIYLNPAARRLLAGVGVDPDTALGRAIWDTMPALRGSLFETETKRAREDSRVVEFEALSPATGRWRENRVVPGNDGTIITFSRDVTDRHLAIDRLRESEERYRALVEASTLMVWRTDRDGMIEDMPVWRELTGQTLEEVRGAGWVNAIHPEDAPLTGARWRAAVASRAPYESQYRLRMNDGSYRWFRARGVPITGPDGEVREWVGVFNDIDHAVRQEEGMRFLAEASAALNESLDERATLDTLARLAVDHLADGSMVTLPLAGGGWDHVATRSRDDDRTAAFAAETERRYPLPPSASSGYPRAIRTGEPELVSAEAFDHRVLPSIAADAEHLERLRRLDMYSAMVIPLVARGVTLGAITLVLHGPGRRRPFDAGDLALAMELGRRAALALDNARLYAAEREARAEAERAAELTRRLQEITASFARTLTIDQVAQTTLSHGVDALSARSGAVYRLDASRRTLELVGSREIADEGIRRYVSVPIDAPVPVAEALRTRETLFLGGRVETLERFPEATDANRHIVADAWVVAPLVHDGVGLGALALGFDGTRVFTPEERVLADALGRHCAQAMERARLLDAERMARREAEMANRAKSELLAKVSHETRQPVHATVGWVDTLALEIHGAMTDAQREALRRIKQNQSRLLSVLNDLLDMSRIEAGKLELHVAPVVVAEVIDSVESAVAPQFADRGIAFDFCRPPETLVAQADRDQLVGILTNLLSNAAKFTPRGGRVSVDCHAEDGKIALAVCDTGIGIAPEVQERVFEPFFQIESGFTRTTIGTGLGLAISREAARAMGGEITLSSEPGRGSVFTVWLPAG